MERSRTPTRPAVVKESTGSQAEKKHCRGWEGGQRQKVEGERQKKSKELGTKIQTGRNEK